MKNLKEVFDGKTFSKESKEEWYQIAGKEMSEFFHMNCYWIVWKYDRTAIERAFDIAKKEKNKALAHFIQNIKNS